MDIGERLIEELNCENVFSFSVFGVPVTIKESIVVMWIIMAVIMLLSLLLTRGLKVEGPLSKRQLFLEMCVDKMAAFFRDAVGPGAEKHLSWLMSLAVIIGASNMVGIFGFKPPTKDMNVTIGLAVASIIYIQVAGIRQKGPGGWLKSFAKPSPVVLMELIKMVVPAVVPMVLSLYFDIFDGFIQAYVFVFLNSIYIQEAISDE